MTRIEDRARKPSKRVRSSTANRRRQCPLGHFGQRAGFFHRQSDPKILQRSSYGVNQVLVSPYYRLSIAQEQTQSLARVRFDVRSFQKTGSDRLNDQTRITLIRLDRRSLREGFHLADFDHDRWQAAFGQSTIQPKRHRPGFKSNSMKHARNCESAWNKGSDSYVERPSLQGFLCLWTRGGRRGHMSSLFAAAPDGCHDDIRVANA
jgi:hypothetical protein